MPCLNLYKSILCCVQRMLPENQKQFSGGVLLKGALSSI